MHLRLCLVIGEKDMAKVKHKGRKLKSNIHVRKTQCTTCVFKSERDGGIVLAQGRREEIRSDCIKGLNQLCHYDNDKTICKGGRDYQLTIWYRLGLIEEPTNAALRKAMKENNIEPSS